MKHVWDWYHAVSESVMRIKNGVCYPIPPSEFYAFTKMTGEIIHPYEYDMLRSIDSVFCVEMSKELSDLEVRKREEHQKNLDDAARGK